MATSDLPRDLLENILSRFPYKSLRDLRFTCKLCNDLFKDREFINKRFHKAAREVIVMMNSKVYSLNIDLNGSNNDNVIKLSRINGNRYIDLNHIYVSDMFNCDGLFLFRTMSNNMFMVWNPCLEQTRFIHPTNKHASGIFALGYHNELCDSYKVLSIHPKRESSELNIYDLNSNSWRALDDVTLGCIIQSRGMSLKGNAYWIASEVIKDFLLLCFDFATEIFRRLNLPSQRHGYEISALSVIRDEQLSILQQRLDTSKVEIWVTTNDKINQTKVLSWKKLLAVNLNTYYDHKFTCDVSFFIHEEKKVVVCWDKGNIYIFGEDHHYGSINFGAYECKPFIRASMFQGWFKFNLEAKDTIWYPISSIPQSGGKKKGKGNCLVEI